MTLHCKTKTKNINLFLSKDQLLSEADTDNYTGEMFGNVVETSFINSDAFHDNCDGCWNLQLMNT